MSTIKFTPRFSGAIFGRAVNICRRFYPQLCAEYDFDDLMQEAFLIFHRCKQLYAGTVDKPQWFMVLFGRALTNKLINLSKKCGRYISIETLDNFDEPATEVDVGFSSRLIQELPDEVRQLMAKVVSGAVADGRLAFAQIQRKHKTV